MDSSGSLRKEYHKEKSFVKYLARSFHISSDGSRAGVVTFSKRAEHTIKLKDHADINSFESAVDKIPLMGLTTSIDKALRLAQKELFAPENGGRSKLKKVLILLTDGTQTKRNGAENPEDITEELRKSGITVLVIGIGDGTNPEELDRMAGESGQAYLPKSFDELIAPEFIKKITTFSCEKASSPICEDGYQLSEDNTICEGNLAITLTIREV